MALLLCGLISTNAQHISIVQSASAILVARFVAAVHICDLFSVIFVAISF
jgi:hypothetical protein